MSNSQKDTALKAFSPRNIFIAIAAGLIGTGILFYYNLQGKSLSSMLEELANPNWVWLVMAVVVLFIRDAGYIFRIKNLTDNELTWKGSFYVIILWEFASAVTPSVVGGTAVAIFLLNKEGIKMGKSIAYVMLTAILDNMFFILAAPLVMIFTADAPFLNEFQTVFGIEWMQFKLKYVLFISYGLIALYTAFMAFGVLINPRLFQKVIVGISNFFRLRKRIKRRMYRLSVDVIIASRELKGKTFSYWTKAVLSTILVWSSRYFIVNCLIAGFIYLSVEGHVDIFSKHVILWISQLVSPTPGAAGLAEYFFEKIIGASIALAVLWRFLTYYLYLVFGSIALPRWLKRVFT